MLQQLPQPTQSIALKQNQNLANEHSLLVELVREAILDQALAGISCSQQEQNEAKEELQKLLGLDYSTPLPESMQLFLERRIKIEKFKQRTWGGQKLRNFFLQRKKEFDRITYSLIRTKEEGIANELFFRLSEGEQTFSELAQAYSQGPEAKTGGRVGPLPLSLPHPKIAQLLTRSAVGQIHRPIKIESWFVLVRLEELIPALLDGQLKQRLLNELYQQWLNKQITTVFEQGDALVGIN